jgi:hypothetical protein
MLEALQIVCGRHDDRVMPPSLQNNCVVRQVFANGTIATFAGEGTCGYSGDGGNANHAQLGNPTDVVVTTTGDVVIADFVRGGGRLGCDARARMSSTVRSCIADAGEQRAALCGSRLSQHHDHRWERHGRFRRRWWECYSFLGSVQRTSGRDGRRFWRSYRRGYRE